MTAKAIITDVNAQYVEEMEEDYFIYKNQTTKTMIKQLQTWYVTKTKEKISIKAHFLAPWSNTPDTHITTFTCQLDMRQVKCEDHGVMVTEDDEVYPFVSQMYACSLFKAKFLDDWKESSDKLWGTTLPQLINQYARERRKMERKQAHNHLEISTAFRKAPHPHTL